MLRAFRPVLTSECPGRAELFGLYDFVVAEMASGAQLDQHRSSTRKRYNACTPEQMVEVLTTWPKLVVNYGHIGRLSIDD